MGKRFHPSLVRQLTLSSVVISMALSSNAFAQTTSFPEYPLRAMQIYVNSQLTAHPDGLYAMDPNSQKNTTFMPIWYVMQSLKYLGIQSTWNGSKWDLQVPTAMETHLKSQNMASPGTGPVSMEVDGALLKRAPSIVAKDPTSSNVTTFVPIWYVGWVLERCGIQITWNGTDWKMTYPPTSSTGTSLSTGLSSSSITSSSTSSSLGSGSTTLSTSSSGSTSPSSSPLSPLTNSLYSMTNSINEGPTL